MSFIFEGAIPPIFKYLTYWLLVLGETFPKDLPQNLRLPTSSNDFDD